MKDSRYLGRIDMLCTYNAHSMRPRCFSDNRGFLGLNCMSSVVYSLLCVEIRLLANKIVNESGAKGAPATNVLFDSAGNGILPLFQNLLDVLEFTSFPASAANYDPTLSLQLEKIPDASYDLEEDRNILEAIITAEFSLRFTLGDRGGTTS